MIWPEKSAGADKGHLVTHQQAPTRPETRTPEARTAARLAAREFFKLALGYVRHSLCRLNVEHVDRDDLAQEIVIAAYLKRREYQPGRASPRQFMHGFVVNYVRNYRRKQHKNRGHMAELPPDLADHAPGTMELYVNERMRQLLHEQLIPQIEFDLVTVVIAHDLDDLDFKTIAEEQGIPIATAHDRYQRGIVALKAAYDRHQRKQKARGLVVLPFSIRQLLAADRAIPDAPADLVRLTWSRTFRALRWQARWPALRAVLRHKVTHLAATLLAGGVGGAVLHAILQPVPRPSPVVFVQSTPADPSPVVAIDTAPPSSPSPAVAAVAMQPASSAPRRDVREEQRALDIAHQAFDRGNLDVALGALAIHERDFPAGAFTSEREILRARIAELQDTGGPTRAPEVDPRPTANP